MAPSAHSTVERLASAMPTGRVGKAVAVGALALAAAAVWNNVRARKAEANHPPMGRFVEINGARVHFLERGTGSPVVLLHGNVVSADDYVWSGCSTVSPEIIAWSHSIDPVTASATGRPESCGRRRRRRNTSARHSPSWVWSDP